MQKRTKLVLAVVILAALLIATVLFTYRPEPTYQGHTLTYWLGECAKEPKLFTAGPEAPECVRAVRAIGTDAIPTLVAWLSYEPHPIKRRLWIRLKLVLGRFIPFPAWTSTDSGQRRLALLGFRILGERSAPALPALTKLANGPNLRAAVPAVFAMGKAGPAAVPFLEMVLTNPAATPRNQAARELGGLGTNAMPALPSLLRCVGDADEEVAAASLRAVGAVMQDERVFAAVTGALNDPRPLIREAAVQALRSGDKAAPFLQRALDDPDKGVRDQAKAILQALASQNPANASR